MLPRSALRALRARPPALSIARVTPRAASSPWARAYADKAKSRTPSHPPPTPTKPAANQLPVHPAEQPEVDAAASPERNTVPKSQPARPTGTATEAATGGDQQASPHAHAPLPDLRHGIPSTFAAEFAEADAQSHQDPNAPGSPGDPLNDPLPGGSSGRSGSGGELPKSAYETSTDRRRNRVANLSYLAILLFGLTGAVFMGRNWDTEQEELANADAPNGWSLGQMYARAAARINGQKAYYTEPTFQKLLPDKDKIPGGAPELTLVLSLEDLLLHSEWTTQHGYRLAKRPGLDYFLRYLSSQYELVIFTTVKSMDGDPIIRKLDPFRLVMWPLFREATRFEKGEYIKVFLSLALYNTSADSPGPLLSQP